jgi:outer membrane protein
MRPDLHAAALGALALLLAAPFPVTGQTLTLSAAVDSALATHPALARAAALADRAGGEVAVARAARLPSLGLETSLLHFQEPMVTTPIHGFDPERLPNFDETLVQGSLALRHTLLDFGDRSAQIRAAESQKNALGAVTRAARAEIIRRVAEAYLRVETSRAVDAAAVARIESFEAEHDRVTRALAVGTVADVDVMRAAVALQDARAERTSSLGALHLAERDLARLMGSSMDFVTDAVLAELDAGAWSGPDATRTSPAVDRAVFDVETARARLTARGASRLPRLDVSAGLLDYGTLSSEHVLEWQAGIRLSWALFTGGARSATIRRAESELLAAERAVDVAMLDVDARADAARTAIEVADARAAALDASVAQWAELVRVEALALETGAGVQRELLDAEAGLFRARAGLVEARGETVLARIRLAEALGELDRTWIDALEGGPR